MELRQLEYFIAVAEEASFTRAADRVHITQSGVSAQIRQLETDLGASLFDRSARAATLTSAGAAALGHARDVLRSVRTLRQAVDDVNDLVSGQLAVGMVTGCTVTPLFDALAAFHHAHPGVALALLEGNSDQLMDGIRAGRTDLALVGAARNLPDDLGAFSIISEQPVAAVPNDHPLARFEQVSLREVIAHPLVCLPRGTGVRAVLDQACTAQGLDPDIALQASAPAAVADLAVRGFGIALLSESMVADDDRLTAVAIDDVDVPALLVLVWSRNVSPALRELVAHCRRAFAAGPSASPTRCPIGPPTGC